MKFKIGAKVIVTSNCLSYGETGRITKYLGYKSPFDEAEFVEVRLDKGGYKNYKETSLEVVNVKEEKQNMATAVTTAVKGNYEVAMVKFVTGTNTSKEYAFALFDKGSVVIGDRVLCDSSTGYGVAEITKIIPQEEYNGVPILREIICKVDFSKFNNRKEVRAKQEQLKKRMDRIIAENQELILYQALADKNPEMAAMLEEYKSLTELI